MKSALWAAALFLACTSISQAASGPITSGERKDGTIGVGTSDTWTITAAVGDSLWFRVAELSGGAGFTPRIELSSPSNAVITSDWHATDAGVSHRATVAGTYTITIRGQVAGDAGTYRLTGYKIPGAFSVPAGDDGGALTNGANHDGAIPLGDLDAWTITAAVGDSLWYRVAEVSGGAAFTPYIVLYGPDGAVITSDWHATDAAVSHRATLAGTYTVVIAGRNAGDAGTYRLTGYKIPGAFSVPAGDDGGALTNGANHDGAIPLGDLDAWTISAAVGDSLWYRVAEVSGGAAFTPYIVLYGPDGAVITSDWHATDAAVSHRATLAGTYTVVIAGRNAGDIGTYRLTGYKIPGAFSVPAGDDGGALTNGANYDGAIPLGDMDAWTVTAAAGNVLQFRVVELSGGAAFTPYIVLYGPNGAVITSNWHDTDASIVHTAAATGTYTAIVTGRNGGDAGTYRVSVNGATAAIAPSFVTHPASQTIPPGASAALLVSVAGTAPFSYQWRKDGAELAGATSASFTISNAQSSSAGSYTVTVSNSVGSATSNPAVVSIGTVPAAPTIVIHPTAQTVTAGDSVSFTVSASGTAPLAYQWRKDGAALSGASAALLTLSGVTPAQAGAYSVVVSNAAGSVTSGSALLTVNAVPVAPSFVTQPVAQTVNAGAAAGFSVVAAGAAPLSYQWRKDGAAIAGATGTTFSLGAAQSSDAGVYTVVVTNSIGSVTSSGAALTVIPVVASRISNVSVRTTLAANQTLIVGMSMSGGSKPILVRGVGPGLAAFGVTGTMPDPRLALFDGATMTDANDNWGGTAALSTMFASVGAFALPAASLDAALSRTIDGSRTAQITGTIGGNVLVEAYDAGTGNTPRLVNISARNRAGTGNDVLIAGFTISGTASKLVLIRAVGPTLAAFGVNGVLADPKLELYSGATKINENDTWSPTLAATFASVGAFALTSGSKDAALVVSLPPGGGYTVQVSGADGGTGEALVEIYEVQP